jgi:hypothetical protein
MSYEYKHIEVKEEIIKYCKDKVDKNSNAWFDKWLVNEADSAFFDVYYKAFTHHFKKNIDSHTKDTLELLSKNLIYSIKAFLLVNNNYYKHCELLYFVEMIIKEQLDDFENLIDVSEWSEDDITITNQTSKCIRNKGSKTYA